MSGVVSGRSMDHVTRLVFIQRLYAQLLLIDLESGALRRELALFITTLERRNAIIQRLSVLVNEQKRAQVKLEWTRAEERLYYVRSSRKNSREYWTN